MKILVVGGGGREHALVWKLRQSAQVESVWCVPGNGGISAEAECLPGDAGEAEMQRIHAELQSALDRVRDFAEANVSRAGSTEFPVFVR